MDEGGDTVPAVPAGSIPDVPENSNKQMPPEPAADIVFDGTTPPSRSKGLTASSYVMCQSHVLQCSSVRLCYIAPCIWLHAYCLHEGGLMLLPQESLLFFRLCAFRSISRVINRMDSFIMIDTVSIYRWRRLGL